MIPLDDNHDGIALTGQTQTLPEYIKGTPPSIERLRKRFDEAREDPHQGREKSQKARDYYDGPKQLDPETRALMKTRSQPPIYTNRIRPAINGILGILEQARSDPQAYPRNPNDEDTAGVVTKVLRFIADKGKFGDLKQDVAENFLIEGTGAGMVEMDGDEIMPVQIRWEEFYADPFARRNDFLDARYMGVAKWVDADTLKSRPGFDMESFGDPLAIQSFGIAGDSWQDRPAHLGWVDMRRRRLLLVEEYAVEEGEWKRIVFCAAGVLEYGPSPYLDEKGRPRNPIRAISCYVDRDNRRYGPCEDMLPIQDEINASRSRSLALGNSRQIQQTDPLVVPEANQEEARKEAARHDGVIPAGWSLVPTQDMQQAAILRQQEAKGEIERMGPTPAVLGRQEGAGQSGRARLVSQQAGLTELSRPLARLASWELAMLQDAWLCARQFKTDPWFIRVTDENQAAEFIQVNEPEMGMVMQPQQVGTDEAGQPVVQMVPGIGVVGYKNRLAEMDVDIILDTVPDTANLQQEIWAELVQLAGQAGGLQAITTPEFEWAVDASQLSDKRRVLDSLKKLREQKEQAIVPQLQAQIEQLTGQLQAKQAVSQEQEQAKTGKLLAETDSIEAKTIKMALDAVKPDEGEDAAGRA